MNKNNKQGNAYSLSKCAETAEKMLDILKKDIRGLCAEDRAQYVNSVAAMIAAECGCR